MTEESYTRAGILAFEIDNLQEQLTKLNQGGFSEVTISGSANLVKVSVPADTDVAKAFIDNLAVYTKAELQKRQEEFAAL